MPVARRGAMLSTKMVAYLGKKFKRVFSLRNQILTRPPVWVRVRTSTLPLIKPYRSVSNHCNGPAPNTVLVVATTVYNWTSPSPSSTLPLTGILTLRIRTSSARSDLTLNLQHPMVRTTTQLGQANLTRHPSSKRPRGPGYPF